MKDLMINARIANAADTPNIADTAHAVDRRGSPRRPIGLDARVRELGSEGSEARVINISDTGFMAESAGDFDVGSRVWLILPARDRASAVVRWTAGDRLGAEFSEPISIDGLGGD